jgi:hypothetical protein
MGHKAKILSISIRGENSITGILLFLLFFTCKCKKITNFFKFKNIGNSRKLPETLDEWWEKVSPVVTFPRLIAKSWSAFSKGHVISKSQLPAKKAKSFSKCRRRLFGAKNCQMSQL